MTLIIYKGEKSTCAKKGRFFFIHSIVSIPISHALVRFRIDVHNWYAQVECVCVPAFASRWYRMFRSDSACGRSCTSVLDVHYVSMIGYRYFKPNLNCLETNEQQQSRRFRRRSAQ